MLKLLSICLLATAMLGAVFFFVGVFSDIGIAIISAILVILGLFGWYFFKSLDSGLKEEAKGQDTRV